MSEYTSEKIAANDCKNTCCYLLHFVAISLYNMYKTDRHPHYYEKTEAIGYRPTIYFVNGDVKIRPTKCSVTVSAKAKNRLMWIEIRTS
jgi:hypothetical protein